MAEFTPVLADVASLLRSRIVDENGNELDEWTADTDPSADQVQVEIDRGVRDVRRDVGAVLDTTDDTALIASAADLAALRAAMYVEASFYSEQTDGGQDVYPLFKRLYDEGLRSIRRGSKRATSVTMESPYGGGVVDDITAILE